MASVHDNEDTRDPLDDGDLDRASANAEPLIHDFAGSVSVHTERLEVRRHLIDSSLPCLSSRRVIGVNTDPLGVEGGVGVHEYGFTSSEQSIDRRSREGEKVVTPLFASRALDLIGLMIPDRIANPSERRCDVGRKSDTVGDLPLIQLFGHLGNPDTLGAILNETRHDADQSVVGAQNGPARITCVDAPSANNQCSPFDLESTQAQGRDAMCPNSPVAPLFMANGRDRGTNRVAKGRVQRESDGAFAVEFVERAGDSNDRQIQTVVEVFSEAPDEGGISRRIVPERNPDRVRRSVLLLVANYVSGGEHVQFSALDHEYDSSAGS